MHKHWTLAVRAVGCVFLSLFELALVSHAADPPSDEEIARAIQELGASEYPRREAAGDFLWRSGAAAQAHLREATHSADPEVRTRARAVLQKMRWGLSPETPEEIVSLAGEFQAAHLGYDRREIVRKLAAQKTWRLIFELLRTLPEAEDRRVLLSTLTKDIQAAIRDLIQQEKWDDAEAALQVLVASDISTLPQLLSFLVVTGRIDEAIGGWRERIAEDQDGGRREDWIRLTYLLRAKGDVPAMLEASERTNDPILRMYLLAEAGQWRESAQVAEKLYEDHSDHFETASWAATCFGLAEARDDFQRMLTVVTEKARRDLAAAENSAENRVLAKDLRIAAKCLLVNDQIDAGLDLLRRIDPQFVHRIYWWQQRHTEALRLANVQLDSELDQKWLAELPIPLPLQPLSPDYRIQFAGQIARQLVELGRKEQARQIWQVLRDCEIPSGEGAKRLSLLAALAWQLGRDTDATRTAAEAMAAGATPATLFTLMAGRHSPLAQVWYERKLAADPKTDRATAMSDAIRMVLPIPRPGQPPTKWLQTMEAARASLSKLAPAAKASRLVPFGHTAEIRGNEELARQLFFEAAATDAKYSQQAGEMEALAGSWSAAAEHFGAAAKANATNRVVYYLWADALIRAGNNEIGTAQMRQVNLDYLAPDARHTLTRSLVQRWLKDAAKGQHDIICRTAYPISWHYANSAKDRGNLLSNDEPERAIHGWLQELLHVLGPTSNFTEPDGYPALVHTMHMTRARVAIAEGGTQRAARELAICEKIRPGDMRLALASLPRLRAAGMDALFEKLFQQTFQAQRQICQEFPQAATHLNNVAWICARSQRQLEEALEFAQQAVFLAPDSAAYQDTLAEAHFQLGNREAAVAAARRSLELSGSTKQSLARLRHFSESELKTLDGTH